MGEISEGGIKLGYRPVPHDFMPRWAAVGWDGAEAEFNVHKTTLVRWIAHLGEENCQRARREYLEAKYAAEGKRIPGVRPGQKRASRYVMGRTLTAVNASKREA